MPNTDLMRAIPPDLKPVVAQILLNVAAASTPQEWMSIPLVLRLTASITNDDYDQWLANRSVQS